MPATRSTTDRRGNAFDLLRLTAALLVIADHSWVITGHPGFPLGGGSGTDLGQLAVGMFFLLSGYLVSSSWLGDPSLRRFAGRRLLRIYPAYAVVILLLVFLVGPVFGAGSGYFRQTGTWRFLGDNLLIIPMQYPLPGIFAHTPYPLVADGSLWTIRVEICCYAGVALLGVLTLVRRRWALAALAGLGLAVATAIHVTGYHGMLVPDLLGPDAAQPIAYFGLGMVARAFLPDTPPPVWLVPATALLWALTWGTPLAALGSILCVATLTFTIAFRAPSALHRPTGGYDLSYGTYLLAFPVQEILAVWGIREFVLHALLTTLIVLPLAALSWRLVERPALRFKPSRPKLAGDGLRINAESAA